MKSAIVVGAGLAGLAAALELARHGVRVEIFERAAQPGGRAQTLVSPDGRFRFDMGPTILTMTPVLRRALGDDAFEALGVRRLEPGYRVAWPDGTSFDMHSDVSLWLSEVAKFRSGAAGSALAYLAKMHEVFNGANEALFGTSWDSAALRDALAHAPPLRAWMFGALPRFARKHLVHPRLVEAATFQTLYLGMTPSRSPALYGLLMSSEVCGGVWHARGGMSAVVAALVAECERYGVRVRYDAPVSRVLVSNGRARGVVADGETFVSDAVVVASDREPALRALFGERSRRRIRYGHSAFVAYLGYRRPLPLQHHTMLLPDDPWRAYRELDAGRIPRNLLVYACHPAATDDTASEGAVTALVVVPNRRALAELDEHELVARLAQRIADATGVDAGDLAFTAHRGPKEFERALGLEAGAAFGPHHGLSQMGPLRPSIAYPGAANVAFAGSGTHPGSGVPMVLISGRLAAEHVLRAA